MHERYARTLTLPLTLMLSATPLAAGGGEEWLTLDRELEALASLPQAPPEDGVHVGLLLRTNYAWFEESPVLPDTHYAGFALDNVRPWIEGRVGPTTLRLGLEAQSGTALVLDAYARTTVTEDLEFTMGQFLPAVLRSSLVEPQNQLFILRTGPGAFWHARDAGAELAALLDTVLLRGSFLNGVDGAGDEPAFALRADWNAVGTVPLVEGAYGSGRQTCLAVGASWYDDASALEDGDVLSADAILTTDRFSVAGEFQSYADDGGVDPGSGVLDGIYGNFSDTTPWAATASFMVDPDRYELGVRYETLDDQYETSAVTVGVNAYLAGHDLMWQFNYSQVDSDRSDQDGGAFGIGLTVNI
jgi:hypothetical protein